MVLQECGAQLGSPLRVTGGQGAARATSAPTSTALSAKFISNCEPAGVQT